MKKTLLIIIAAIISGFAASAQVPVFELDLNHPTNPSEINYTEKGYWDGTYSEDHPSLEFGEFTLSHLVSGASYGGTYWDGFTVSINGEDTNYFDENIEGSFISEHWGCMAKDEVTPYLVGYWSEYGDVENNRVLQVSFDTEYTYYDTYVAEEVYIANHPYTYYAAKGYDAFARALDQEGDYLKLIFHGIDEYGNETDKKVEHILAECKVAGEIEISTDWQYVGLRELGDISGFYCTMESTDVGVYGTNTPTLFCMHGLFIVSATNNIDNVTLSNVKLASNRITNEVRLETEQRLEQVSIFNLSGGMLYQATDVEGTLSVPTAHWQSGMYILKATSGGVSQSYKLIKK